MLKRGRKYLIAEQQEDGSWKETTRPAGGVSYGSAPLDDGVGDAALLEIERPMGSRLVT